MRSLWILMLVALAAGGGGGEPEAASARPACWKTGADDDNGLELLLQGLVPRTSDRRLLGPEGFAGTVGVVGGHNRDAGAPYFAAIAALKTGADAAHVFCTADSAVAIQSFSPDVRVHPMFNGPVATLLAWLATMDAVVLGPGADREPYSINVINQVIALCKSAHKPLVLALDEWFWTPNLAGQLVNYPRPGVVVVAGPGQYDKLFAEMKVAGAGADKSDIDFKKFGENVLVVREGCADTGAGAAEAVAWALAGGPARRGSARGPVLAGAAAPLFLWALRRLPLAPEPPLLPAALASYAAARIARKANDLAYERKKSSMVASDMIAVMHLAVNDIF